MSSSLVSSGGSSLSTCSLSSSSSSCQTLSSSQTTSFTNTVHLPPPITRIATLILENSSSLDSSQHESEQKTKKEFPAETEKSKPDQSRPLSEIHLNFAGTEPLIGTQKGELIKKYTNCFKLFKVDSEDSLYLSNGEKTALKCSLFFNGIIKTMHTHLSQPGLSEDCLSQDCEFSENVGGRFFDIQFKEGNLTILSPEEMVSSGGTCTLFRALDLTAGKVVAQKIANLSSPDPRMIDAIVSSFYDEHRTAKLLPKNEHYVCATNIICAINLSAQPTTSELVSNEHSSSLKWRNYRLILTLPFCSKGDLHSLLAEKLSLHARIQLASSVWNINKELRLTDRFWHRDIKPENYMVLTFPKLALIDWAGVKQRSFLDDKTNLDLTKFPVHTPLCSFSEIFDQLHAAFSEKNSELAAQLLDQEMLYTTATAMFTVLCNQSPRPLKENNFQDMSKDIDDSFLKHYPPLLVNFIMDLLHSDPKKRLLSWEEADKRFKEISEIIYKSEMT